MNDVREPLRLRLRARAEQATGGIVCLLAGLGVSPNALTVAGGMLAVAAAWPAARGAFALAGAMFLAGSLLDALDGPLARHLGRESRFGAVLDAVVDRLGEGALLAGLAIRFASQGEPGWAAAAAAALVLSFLTSYLRAWGERFRIAMAADWLTRPERVAVLSAGLFAGFPKPAVAIVAGLASVTVGFRLWRIGRA